MNLLSIYDCTHPLAKFMKQLATVKTPRYGGEKKSKDDGLCTGGETEDYLSDDIDDDKCHS